MFSKHLAELAWGDLGTAVRQAGFDGVDLTVRPGGHVLPARVTEDLPRAVAAIRDAGSLVAMLTTGLTQPDDPAARATFEAARAVDVPRLKAGYYRYAFADVRRELAEATTAFHALVRMAAAAGVVLAYHNHSGDYVGAPVWDALRMIEGQPADATGLYFDVRHATVEGGLGGWRAAVQMAAPHLRMLAIKDFYWEKGTNGRWRVVDCPVGDGMVDWKAFGRRVEGGEVQRSDVAACRVRPGRAHDGGEDRTDAGGGGAGPHPPGGDCWEESRPRPGMAPAAEARSALLLRLDGRVVELAGPAGDASDGGAIETVAALPALLAHGHEACLEEQAQVLRESLAGSCRRARPVR